MTTDIKCTFISELRLVLWLAAGASVVATTILLAFTIGINFCVIAHNRQLSDVANIMHIYQKGYGVLWVYLFLCSVGIFLSVWIFRYLLSTRLSNTQCKTKEYADLDPKNMGMHKKTEKEQTK